MVEHDVTNTQFFKKTTRLIFSEILMKDVKLMLEKVRKVSRRYLALFLNYRENPAGGEAESAPPPPGRGAV